MTRFRLGQDVMRALALGLREASERAFNI
jgi:hypothetical protein